ncbi:MgtC/SapB family protein [Piscinibacter sakaiensis]|uniref:MgtC/SapB family protein n=1 Tax=Piscinibacter sakaiensis TaxID=1547922 RepID=UPI003AAEFFDA
MDLELVLAVVSSEFTDLPDAGEVARIVIRLLTAALLGGLLGFNREKHNKSAGLRTHMLVALGAATFVMVPQLAGMEIADLSRVIQGVIAGIGFIGAGTILKHHDEKEVFGLTTAAGIWMTAAIGMACGMGREVTAIISTLLAWAVLGVMHKLFEARDSKKDTA